MYLVFRRREHLPPDAPVTSAPTHSRRCVAHTCLSCGILVPWRCSAPFALEGAPLFGDTLDFSSTLPCGASGKCDMGSMLPAGPAETDELFVLARPTALPPLSPIIGARCRRARRRRWTEYVERPARFATTAAHAASAKIVCAPAAAASGPRPMAAERRGARPMRLWRRFGSQASPAA